MASVANPDAMVATPSLVRNSGQSLRHSEGGDGESSACKSGGTSTFDCAQALEDKPRLHESTDAQDNARSR